MVVDNVGKLRSTVDIASNPTSWCLVIGMAHHSGHCGCWKPPISELLRHCRREATSLPTIWGMFRVGLATSKYSMGTGCWIPPTMVGSMLLAIGSILLACWLSSTIGKPSLTITRVNHCEQSFTIARMDRLTHPRRPPAFPRVLRIAL